MLAVSPFVVSLSIPSVLSLSKDERRSELPFDKLRANVGYLDQFLSIAANSRK